MWLQNLFVMVAFILHLGNVAFDEQEGDAVVSSDETLRIIDTVCNNQLAKCTLQQFKFC